MYCQMIDLLCVEVGSEVLTADFLQILDVVLVSSYQQQVTLVRQILQTAAIDELDHVRHGYKVQILR